MNNIATTAGRSEISVSLHANQKVVENHKKTAGYLVTAAAHHFKAAYYLNEGNYDKASQSALLAKEYLGLASEAKREELIR